MITAVKIMSMGPFKETNAIKQWNFIIITHICTFAYAQTSTHTSALTSPHIWAHACPLRNTCCVTFSTLDWVFSWLNTWNWNYPNKLFWQLLKVFWSKPERLFSQCFHTESVPVTVILCLFFMLELGFFLFHCSSFAKIKIKGNKATFCGFEDLLLGESSGSNYFYNLFIVILSCYFVTVM